MPQWQALSAVSGLPIFVPCGVLFFFSAVEDDYSATASTCTGNSACRSSSWTGRQMQRRFPMIDFTGIEIGLFEPEVRRADGATRGADAGRSLRSRRRRVSPGAAALPAPGNGVDRGGEACQSARKPCADAFVFALGPWLPKLFPDVLGKKIFATRQEVFYFATARRATAASFRTPCPAGPTSTPATSSTAFPTSRGAASSSPMTSMAFRSIPTRRIAGRPQAALDEVIAFRDRRFPLLAGAPLIGAEVCQYENSSNGDFLIDFHPHLSNVVLVGGGSGHGFKHGPEVGRYAAARLFGAVKAEPRFSLATKGETQHREVH